MKKVWSFIKKIPKWIWAGVAVVFAALWAVVRLGKSLRPGRATRPRYPAKTEEQAKAERERIEEHAVSERERINEKYDKLESDWVDRFGDGSE